MIHVIRLQFQTSKSQFLLKKRRVGQFARHLISDTMFDFSSMGVECDKAAMAVWQALHEPGLGSELRTGGTLAREQA